MRLLRSRAGRAAHDDFQRSFRDMDDETDEQPIERRRRARDRQRARAVKVARTAGRDPLGAPSEIAAGARLMRGW